MESDNARNLILQKIDNKLERILNAINLIAVCKLKKIEPNLEEKKYLSIKNEFLSKIPEKE